MRLALCIALILGTALGAAAQEPDLRMQAAPETVESGLMAHLLPRFSLKTSIRVALADRGALQIAAGPPGTPVFERGGTVYHLRHDGSADALRFEDWLTSDIGRRTVDSFAPEGGAAFSATVRQAVAAAAATYDGDAVLGEELSLTLCGRCHVINERNRMNGLGSTPSFAVLRGLPNWDARFEAFFALNPHGAFTQVEGVTPPFDKTRPSPIVPIEMTLDDLDAIIAYTAALAPADLGAPVKHQ